MNRFRHVCFFLLALGLGVAGVVTAADLPPADGTLLDDVACPPNTLVTYEQYVERRTARFAEEVEMAKQEGFTMTLPADMAPYLLSREELAKRQKYEGFECRRIRYASDGLAVTGFLWKPKETAGRKLPLILFNRGGNREFGALTPWMKSGFYSFLAEGFVVLASQYRGNDGGEGREEFGGAEVRDVLNLIPLARSLGYIDMENVFTLGWSRGGMMTLLALKAGLPVRAAAVGGAMIDMPAETRRRPAMLSVYRDLIPGFAERPEEAMRERSAMYWPERIDVPLLLLHGGADWRVDAGANALALAQKLHGLGKEYELVVYAGDDHGISLNTNDADRRVVSWFERHKKR